MEEKKLDQGQLTEEQFDEKYTLVKNRIDDNACYGGYMFETYDEDLEYVKQMAQKNINKVWTIVSGEAVEDCDDDDCWFYADEEPEVMTEEMESHLRKAHTSSTVYIAGFHFVNREGYLITNEEWTDENEHCVLDCE